MDIQKGEVPTVSRGRSRGMRERERDEREREEREERKKERETERERERETGRERGRETERARAIFPRWRQIESREILRPTQENMSPDGCT